MTSRTATSRGTTKERNSADEVEPGDVRPATPCDNDEMTPHMTSSPDIPWHKRRLL